MSAVNVIINRAPVWAGALSLALSLTLTCPASALAANASSGAPGGSLAGQLNAMTEKKGPGSGQASDSPAPGSDISELDVVSIINTDEQGERLRLPNFVFCDRATDEAYVVDNGRVTVYGDNFFPVSSIGDGRGLTTATGVYVDGAGNVYVPQASLYDQPARITEYNAAFFPVRQIDLSAMPGVPAANPRNLAIGDNGVMYVAFDSGVRGLLVLDKDGRFSHWLQPMDLIYDRQAIKDSKEAKEQEEEGTPAVKEQPKIDVSELLPELVPKKGEQVFAEEREGGMGPVQINDVQRDKDGNLYLLSTETSKVYIYNQDEEYLYNFGEKGGSSGKLSQPRQLVVDDKKKAIYVLDYMRQSILIYDLSGRFMSEVGGEGNRPGWFQSPTSLTANSKGELLVADMFNRRVQVLDVKFEYKFPLFQVPFVYEQNDVRQPRPVQASSNRLYGPGYPPGAQALNGEKGKEEIRALLGEDGDVM